MNLLVKFPSRSRPSKFFACIENIQSLIGIENYSIAATLDLDDITMNNPEVKEKLKKYDNLIVYWGLSKNKIDACNRSIPLNTDWDLLLLMSDDMQFLKRDFGKIILRDFQESFPDNDGILHYPDGHQNERIVTLPIMGRKYYQRTNYIYNPLYESVYCDTEMTEVAKKLDRYKYIPTKLFIHNHPKKNKALWDYQYRKTEDPELKKKDKTTFLKRQAINFDL